MAEYDDGAYYTVQLNNKLLVFFFMATPGNCRSRVPVRRDDRTWRDGRTWSPERHLGGSRKVVPSIYSSARTELD